MFELVIDDSELKDVMRRIQLMEEQEVSAATLNDIGQTGVQKAQNHLRQNGSVKTQQLLKGISFKTYSSRNNERVTWNATAYNSKGDNYAPYVEYGTIKSTAKPFMRPMLSEMGPIAAQKAMEEKLNAFTKGRTTLKNTISTPSKSSLSTRTKTRNYQGHVKYHKRG